MNNEQDHEEKQNYGKMVEEKFLRASGVWPLNADRFASIVRWSFLVLTQVGAACSVSLEIYRHCLDMDDTMDACLVNLSFVVSSWKMCIMRLKRRHSHVLVSSIAKDWSVVKDSRQRRVMIEYFQRGRTISMMIIYLCYSSAITFMIKGMPLDGFLVSQGSQNSTKSYVLPTYCVFGSPPFTFRLCVYIVQSVQFLVNATIHGGNDSFFFTLAMHLCGQFEVLKMSWAEIETQGIVNPKKIGLLVKRHCRLIVLAEKFEQYFNMIILAQLLMSAVLIGLEGFLLLICLNAKNNSDALKRVVIMLTLLVQLYMYAYAGDNLESRFDDIAYAAYNSPWYRFRDRSARDLILVISRGNTPYHVTAGKFIPINLDTFKEILKTSFSYLSVLRVMIDG